MHICLTLQIKVEVCFPFSKLAVTCLVHFSCVHCVTAPTCYICWLPKRIPRVGSVCVSVCFKHFVPLVLGLVLAGMVSGTVISERAILLHSFSDHELENRCSEQFNITYNVMLHRERGWRDQELH